MGVIFIDDCSGDRTHAIVSALLAERIDVMAIKQSERLWATANIDFAIRECCSNPESVIFVVDGDDWLTCPTAIAEMMECHKTADVVWSRYENSDGGRTWCGPLTGNDIRHHPWVTSHLSSFKKFLYDSINPVDFLDADGKPYRMTYDHAMMLPMLEQVPPERRRFYDKVLYTYNRENPENDSKVNFNEQERMAARIRAQKPYSLHLRYWAGR
jgi:glycosyltransferase involved in cell wall biosynthesis